jgi:hypothetical protein
LKNFTVPIANAFPLHYRAGPDDPLIRSIW